MEETNPNPSGETNDGLVGKSKDEVVKYETYQKTLAQEKAAKERERQALQKAEELEAKVMQFERAQKTAEEAELNKKGEYQKILELREQELKKTKEEMDVFLSENQQLKKRMEDTEKLQAFYAKLPGQIKKPQYLNFVDLDSILLDPESGEIDEKSLESVVGDFVEEHSSLIKMSNFSGLPSDSPIGSTRRLTLQEWKSLSLKDKKTNWSRRPSL